MKITTPWAEIIRRHYGRRNSRCASDLTRRRRTEPENERDVHNGERLILDRWMKRHCDSPRLIIGPNRLSCNLSLWKNRLSIMTLFPALLINFPCTGCHKSGVPLGTAREERSLWWSQSDRIVSAIKADKTEARIEVSRQSLMCFFRLNVEAEPRAWTAS